MWKERTTFKLLNNSCIGLCCVAGMGSGTGNAAVGETDPGTTLMEFAVQGGAWEGVKNSVEQVRGQEVSARRKLKQIELM